MINKKLKTAKIFTVLKISRASMEDLAFQIAYLKDHNLLKDEMELTISKNGPVYYTFFPTRESTNG